MNAEDHAVSPAAALAERYGLSGWGEIESIQYTFNVSLPDGRTITRAWVWRPIEEVYTASMSVMVSPDGTRTVANGDGVFHSVAGDGEASRGAAGHTQFINDSYWLLFPFQLVWSDPTVTAAGVQPLPLGGGEGQKLICQWPAEGGYTPGDAYDLYLAEDGLIQQWVFRRGGQDNGRAHTWEDHQRLGPIIISLDHHGPEGSGFRLWFTDVKATLTDGTLVEPQPIAEP
ncbi:MAG: hypothetical protein AAGF84_14850 [Planctomycetota bacterium]